MNKENVVIDFLSELKKDFEKYINVNEFYNVSIELGVHSDSVFQTGEKKDLYTYSLYGYIGSGADSKSYLGVGQTYQEALQDFKKSAKIYETLN